MKITHATWEKRNLGVDAYEVEVEVSDTIETLKEKSHLFESEYTVIKVPTTMTDVSFYLQSQGYLFIEALTSCYHVGQLPVTSSLQKRVIDSISCMEMNRSGYVFMRSEIRGGMFQGDRISVDPNFTEEQANKRYLGWVSDELDRKSQFYELTYKDKRVGFFILRNLGPGVYLASLGGIYPNYQKYGFGLSLNYYEIYESAKQNIRRIETSFSSNNRGATSLHLSVGYILKEQYYVFVRHN
ncbi:MAG: hypothetical protein HOK80_09270 [Candidatus Cloacimonetes bacterium]|jgi:hypothetical protein|nr:hypothetical protein [Candidatus Cloacimonadota bacterium]